MVVKTLILNRDVTQQECHWLFRTYKKGELVYEYFGATYGCISPGGLAVTDEMGIGAPFFQLPENALSIPKQNEKRFVLQRGLCDKVNRADNEPLNNGHWHNFAFADTKVDLLEEMVGNLNAGFTDCDYYYRIIDRKLNKVYNY